MQASLLGCPPSSLPLLFPVALLTLLSPNTCPTDSGQTKVCNWIHMLSSDPNMNTQKKMFQSFLRFDLLVRWSMQQSLKERKRRLTDWRGFAISFANFTWYCVTQLCAEACQKTQMPESFPFQASHPCYGCRSTHHTCCTRS